MDLWPEREAVPQCSCCRSGRADCSQLWVHSFGRMAAGLRLHRLASPSWFQMLPDCKCTQASDPAFKLSCQTLMTQGDEESQQNTRRPAWYPKVNQNICWLSTSVGVNARCILITMFKSSDHQRPMSMTPSMTERVLPSFPRSPVCSNCPSVYGFGWNGSSNMDEKVGPGIWDATIFFTHSLCKTFQM